MQLQQWVVEIEMGNHKAPWEPPRNPQLILGAGQGAFWETKLITEGWVKSARSWVVGGVGKYSWGTSSCKGPGVREWLACLGNTRGGIFLSCSLQYHQCLQHWLSHSMSINTYWMHEKAELRPTAFAFCLPEFGLSGGNLNFLKKVSVWFLFLSHKAESILCFICWWIPSL